jgi:hypothetical protein
LKIEAFCQNQKQVSGRSVVAARLTHHYPLAIGQIPNTVLGALNEGLASEAAIRVAQYKLRSSDALYSPVDALFAAEQATLEREQLERGSSIVQTMKPSDFMSTIK